MGNVNGKVEPNEDAACDGEGDEARRLSSSDSFHKDGTKAAQKLAELLTLPGAVSKGPHELTVGMISAMFSKSKSKTEVNTEKPPTTPSTIENAKLAKAEEPKEEVPVEEPRVEVTESLIDTEPEQTKCTFADCIRKITPCCQKNSSSLFSDYDLHIDPETPPRIMKSLDAIGDYFRQTFESLQSEESSKEKNFEMKTTILEVIRCCNQGIQLLHRVHEDCGDSLKDLSYYFEQNITADQRQLIKGRSAIGSYMWLIVLAMQSIRLGPDQDKDFAEIRRVLEDIVGESFVIWRGIRHIVDAFLEVRDKTEELLKDQMEIYNPDVNLKAFLIQKTKPATEIGSDEYSKIVSEQRKNCKQRRRDLAANRKERKRLILLHNIVGGNEHSDYDGLDPSIPLQPPPDVYIARSRVDIVDQWMPFQKLRSRDRMIDLTQLVRKVMSLHEDVLENLRNMDRCLHLIYLDDQNPSEMSYIQVIAHMKRWLKRVKRSQDLLDPNDFKVLNAMSCVLSDEMHITEFLIMTLRSVIHESRHVIHVAYAYARVFNRSLLMYEEIAPPNELTFCERIGWKRAKEDFECRKISLRTAIALFNSSPYIKILLAFPISFDRRYQLMLKPLGADMKLQGIPPPLGGVFRQIAKTKKVVDQVSSAAEARRKNKQQQWKKK